MNVETLIGIIAAGIAGVVQAGLAAAQAAQFAEAEVLARLQVVLTAESARVGARLAELDAARTEADAQVVAAGPTV